MVLYTDSLDKAEILSEQFKSVVTKNDSTEVHLMGSSFPQSTLVITIEEIETLFANINVSKASGPDSIPLKYLK